MWNQLLYIERQIGLAVDIDKRLKFPKIEDNSYLLV